jgi:hypothetical protein
MNPMILAPAQLPVGRAAALRCKTFGGVGARCNLNTAGDIPHCTAIGYPAIDSHKTSWIQ